MKLVRFQLILFCLPIIWWGCEEPVRLDESASFLKTIIESRYTPDDSLTITYRFDQTNRLQREERKLPFAPGRIIDLYESKDLSQVYADQCRIHTYNAQNQELLVKKYFPSSGSWLLYDSDSLIYSDNQLVRQEHKDYFFIVDGGQYAFAFPLWLTTRTIAYDNQGHIASETDSVFITHDIPAGSSVLTKAAARYLHTNKTTYTYDEKGMVTKAAAVSGDVKKPMFYSNGWYALSADGKGYASSVRLRFMPGTTTYVYEYNINRQLSRKTAAYNNGKSPQNYISSFTYEYGMKQ